MSRGMTGSTRVCRAAAISMLLIAVSIIGCGRSVPRPPQLDRNGGDEFTAEIRVGPAVANVNRLLLGGNVQWIDRGDGLLNTDGSGFDPEMVKPVEDLAPTVIRYPGGSLTDTFNWRSGTGPLAARGTSENFFSRERQPVLFGTAELLALSERLGAQVLISVNTATGSAQDAADWVRAVNRPNGRAAVRPVRYWEIGNEPYLREDVHQDLAVPPQVFADRANAFIKAMREVDDSIVIGVPLRRDRLGTLPAVAFPGFADTVLAAVNERFDFVALHNAFLPFIPATARTYVPEDLFRTAMAAYQVIEEDLRLTRALLHRYHPGRPLLVAITEYNAMYTVNGRYDGNIASLAGALYVADVLRTLASSEDILMANFWSLTGNWWFGAVSNEGAPRPAYQVLRAYAEILRGQRRTVDVLGPTFDAPAVGAVPATRNVPTIAALATTFAGGTNLLIINKSVSSSAVITVNGVSGNVRSARALADARLYDPAHSTGTLRWHDVTGDTSPLRWKMAPHSLLWVELEGV